MVSSTDVPKRGRKLPAEEAFDPEKGTTHIKSSQVDPADALLEAAKTMESATKELTGGKILVKMVSDNFSFLTGDAVRFTKQHPFQLVEEHEANLLISQGGFRKASPQELIDYYSTN